MSNPKIGWWDHKEERRKQIIPKNVSPRDQLLYDRLIAIWVRLEQFEQNWPRWDNFLKNNDKRYRGGKLSEQYEQLFDALIMTLDLLDLDRTAANVVQLMNAIMLHKEGVGHERRPSPD